VTTAATAESQLGPGGGSASGVSGSSSSSTAPIPSAAMAPSSTTTTLYPPVGIGDTTVTSVVPLGDGSQPTSNANVPAAGWEVAVAFAESQIGKPYQWAGAGPSAYDCSGLTMVSWGKAGVTLPHSAQYQYNLTTRVAIGDLLPGDLVFFGTPSDVYHVGIYIGNGQMVDAPETGEDVKIQTIYELSLLGGGRAQ